MRAYVSAYVLACVRACGVGVCRYAYACVNCNHILILCTSSMYFIDVKKSLCRSVNPFSVW